MTQPAHTKQQAGNGAWLTSRRLSLSNRSATT